MRPLQGLFPQGLLSQQFLCIHLSDTDEENNSGKEIVGSFNSTPTDVSDSLPGGPETIEMTGEMLKETVELKKMK